MIWFGFELPQSFIVTNSKQCINCSIFKQASENSPNDFRNICGSKDVAMQNLLKIVKQPVTFEKNLYKRLIKIFVKALENEFNQLSLRGSKSCKGMGYWYHRKCCEIKWTVTLSGLLNRNEIFQVSKCSREIFMMALIKLIVFSVQKLYYEITANIT